MSKTRGVWEKPTEIQIGVAIGVLDGVGVDILLVYNPEQVEDAPAVWVVCAADCASKNHHYPMHCLFV